MRDWQTAHARDLWGEASVVRTENREAVWLLEERQPRHEHDEDSERKG